MPTITVLLPDDTAVALRETGETFNYAITINGRIECCYNDFDFAWEDFGKTVRCATLEDAKMVVKS